MIEQAALSVAMQVCRAMADNPAAFRLPMYPQEAWQRYSRALKPADVLAECRGSPAAAFARQLTTYLLRTQGEGVTLTALGKVMMRHHTTLGHAVETIEAARSIKRIDNAITELEQELEKL